MSSKATVASLKTAIDRYPGVAVIDMPRGQVMITDQNQDASTIYGPENGSTADALAAALVDLVEEYGVK